MAQYSQGWYMTHENNKSYTLECIDGKNVTVGGEQQTESFESQQKTIKINCENQVMTGPVNITVKAKSGAVSANSISYSKNTPGEFTQDNTTDYSNSKIIVTLTQKAAAAAITEGWLTPGDAKDITVSGDLRVSVPIDTTTNSFVPRKNAQGPSPINGRYFKNISIEAVDTLKTKLTGSTHQPSGSGDATEFSMSPFNSIAICGNDNCSIGIKKYNDPSTIYYNDPSTIYFNDPSAIFFGCSDDAEDRTFNGTVYCTTIGNNLVGGDYLYAAEINGPGTYMAINNPNYIYRYRIQLNVRRNNANTSLVLGYLFVNTLYEYNGSIQVRRSFDFYYNDNNTGAGGEHVDVFTMSPEYDEYLV